MNDNTTAYSLRKCSLETLLQSSPIRVPKIQRDYAQGRDNDIATDIRSKFVHNLVTAISPNGSDIELDFVYGSFRNGAFEPLDGQQRLTTLFLLHWICGVNLYDADKRISKLTYETRNTSTDFCLELVKHSPDQFIAEIKQSYSYKNDQLKAAESKLKNLRDMKKDERPEDFPAAYESALKEVAAAKAIKEKSFSSLIPKRDWFNYLWKFDPTIQSMLVMLDALLNEFLSREMDISACKANLSKITFSDLDLGSFDLSDDLFIKMNARGKQLSSFDIIKSTLEEEIQVQKKEGYCNSDTESLWRSLIDGAWIDWFWNQFASGSLGPITEKDDEYKQRLSLAKMAEERLKRLILRLITLRFVKKGNIDDNLLDSCYHDHIENLDRFLIVYNDALRAQRSKEITPDYEKEIHFQDIIEDINGLFYKDGNGTYHDIFSLIKKEHNINAGDPSLTYLDLLLGDRVNNDCKVVFYALLLYVKEVKIILDHGDYGTPDPDWVRNLSEWAHFCRNLFMNENNNRKIDDFANFKDAMLNGVDKIIDLLKKYLSENPSYSTVEFIRSIANTTFTGIDNQSLSEEVQKAGLKLSDSGDNWKKAIDAAEAHPYLWGQVRSLLSWSGDDPKLFDDYFKRFASYYAFSAQKGCEARAYAGLISAYPDHGFKNNKLYWFSSKDRDYGLKRYLRDEEFRKECGIYAPAIKATLDKWMNDFSSSTIEEYLTSSIKASMNGGRNYVTCLLDKPEILNDSWGKMIFQSDSHYVIAQRKTPSSHCYDIALEYLYYTYNESKVRSGSIVFYDSVAQTYKHAILIPYGEKNLLVKAIPNGGYDLTVDDVRTMDFANETEMLNYVLTNYPA